MDVKILLVFVAVIAGSHGTTNDAEPSNYDLSRQIKVGSSGGGGYGNYPNYPGTYQGNYPSNQGNFPGNQGNYPGNQGNYPGVYPSGPGLYPGGNNIGQYPGSNYPAHNPGAVGPPGAHPGCPLCDSSVYSYCSRKEAHDACCCENPAYLPYHCRKSDCKFLYANSCQEYQLISNCCCVDLQKNSIEPVAAVVG